MKKIILLIISVLAFLPLWGQSATDKRNPLDYLEPGKRYSRKDVKEVFRDVEYKEDDSIIEVGFRDISYEYRTEDTDRIVTVNVFLFNDVLKGIELSLLAENGFKKEDCEESKHYLANSNKFKPCDTPEDILEDIPEDMKNDNTLNTISFQYTKDPNKYVTIFELGEDEEFEGYSTLMYTIDDSIFEITIQDTFFNLKLGKTYSVTQVRQTFAGNGNYVETNNLGNIKQYVFSDVYFGGYKWDCVNVFLTNKNEFCRIDFESSYPDYYRERKDADTRFDAVLENLSDKYGYHRGDSDENNDREVFYIGDNDIICSLLSERSKSKKGDYRRYVTLKYLHIELYRSVLDEDANEF